MKFSTQWNIIMDARKTAPVDVHSLPARLGIEFKQAYLAKDIAGMLEKNGDSFLITVQARDIPVRQRFTLAHELGHYMLHRRLIGDGLDDDRAYRSTEIGKYHNTRIGPAEEKDANRFAVNLLMPRELIASERRRLNDDIQKMADLFQVSKQTMSIRLKGP